MRYSVACISERSGEILPELVDIFEADREPQQSGGMRSPSQRWRLSIVELTPPRLVAFVITCVLVSTAPRVGDVERDQPRVAGVADDLDRRMPGEDGARARPPSR